ncbi:MAG: PilZ domain-containing protein [Acidobacteria bacterium]|nr:PilZ domain-containing protein [Acidobacteriota bacterium]
MNERRQYVRVPTREMVLFREMSIPKDLFAEDRATTRNISPGGIQFESPRNIPEGTVLKLQIELKNWARFLKGPEKARFANLPLKILGEVVHCEKADGEEVYSVGVKFLGLDPWFQEAILTYLKEMFPEE